MGEAFGPNLPGTGAVTAAKFAHNDSEGHGPGSPREIGDVAVIATMNRGGRVLAVGTGGLGKGGCTMNGNARLQQIDRQNLNAGIEAKDCVQEACG